MGGGKTAAGDGGAVVEEGEGNVGVTIGVGEGEDNVGMAGEEGTE